MRAGTHLDASTQASLMALSTAVQNAKASGVPDAEVANLAASVTKKIESQLVSLRGTSADLAEKVLQIINNKEWAELPSTSNLELTLTRINEVTDALSQVTDNVMTDIGEIYRIILELSSQNMLQNRKAQVLSNESSVAESKNAIADREKASWMSFGAELAGSVAQLATATMTLKGAKESLSKVKDSVQASKDAHDMTVGENADDPGSLISLKGKADAAAQKLASIDKRLESIPHDHPQRREFTEARTDAARNHAEEKNKVELANHQVEQKQAESMNSRLLADAKMQINRARGEIMGASVNVASAVLKLGSSLINLDADKHDINKSLAEKTYQSSQEVVSSARETLRGLLNSLQAIEQVLSNTNSVLARNSA
jgi:hypothetical protein